MKRKALTMVSSLVLSTAKHSALSNAPKMGLICEPKIPSTLLKK